MLVCVCVWVWVRERERGQWRLTSEASWHKTLANKWNIAAARGDSCECEAAWHWAALDGMSQSPDEAIYHHIHLHTIITHQKGHVPLCQAADTIPCFQLCTKILYKSLYVPSSGSDVYTHAYAYMQRERAQQWPKETKDEGRDLIPCGKREEIFACVCKA